MAALSIGEPEFFDAKAALAVLPTLKLVRPGELAFSLDTDSQENT
jgi:hypothetical protein